MFDELVYQQVIFPMGAYTSHLYCWWRCEQFISIQHCTCEHALGRCFMTPHFRPPHLTLSRFHGSVSHSWCLSVVDFKTHHVQRIITWIWHPGSCSVVRLCLCMCMQSHTNRITTLLNMHSIAQRLYDIMTSTTQMFVLLVQRHYIYIWEYRIIKISRI